MAKIFMFNAHLFAERLARVCKTGEMTVQVVDDDLKLCINVYDGSPALVDEGDAVLVSQHDTGLDGNEYSPETEKLADQLVAALVGIGVKAHKYEWQDA